MEKKSENKVVEASENSVQRIAKIPVIESTGNLVHKAYDKVKGSHSVITSALTSAEDNLKKAAEFTSEKAQPILESPQLDIPKKIVHKVDSALCSGLDYIEEKVPAIMLPPGEMYETTKIVINAKVIEPVKSKVPFMRGTRNEATDHPSSKPTSDL